MDWSWSSFALGLITGASLGVALAGLLASFGDDDRLLSGDDEPSY